MTIYKRPTNAFDLLRRLGGRDLSLAERSVLLAQYRFGDIDGTNSYASEDTLAKYLNVSARTVRDHRRTLREKGWLVEKRRGRNTGGKPMSSEYEVVIPVPTPLPAAAKPKRVPNPDGRNQHALGGKILPVAQEEEPRENPRTQEEEFNHLPEVPKIEVVETSDQSGFVAPDGARHCPECGFLDPMHRHEGYGPPVCTRYLAMNPGAGDRRQPEDYPF